MPNACLLSPYIRLAMDNTINPPWILRERVIFDYELLFVKEGKALISIEKNDYIGRAGDIYLLKPGQRHSIKLIDNFKLHQPHIHFDLFQTEDSTSVKVSFRPLEEMSKEEQLQIRKDITSGTVFDLPNKLYVSNINYFESLLFELIREYNNRKPYYELRLKSLFLDLWTYLLRENAYRNNNHMVSIQYELMEQIKQYLKNHTKREVSLDELAKVFNINKYHLNRSFSKVFNITPIRFHRMMRIEKTKEMIQYSHQSLTHISDMFGFSSINSFSRTFKNIEGVPPSYYRY